MTDRFDVRPLTSFALKSITDTLRFQAPEKNVLDLFAGQGRFGFALLELGAKNVTFVENNPRTFHVLTTESKKSSGKVTLVLDDCFNFLSTSTETFDIIFFDPPYPLWSEAFQKKYLSLLKPKLTSQGILLVRHPHKVVVLPQTLNLSLWKQKRVGESLLSYFNH